MGWKLLVSLVFPLFAWLWQRDWVRGPLLRGGGGSGRDGRSAVTGCCLWLPLLMALAPVVEPLTQRLVVLVLQGWLLLLLLLS